MKFSFNRLFHPPTAADGLSDRELAEVASKVTVREDEGGEVATVETGIDGGGIEVKLADADLAALKRVKES